MKREACRTLRGREPERGGTGTVPMVKPPSLFLSQWKSTKTGGNKSGIYVCISLSKITVKEGTLTLFWEEVT